MTRSVEQFAITRLDSAETATFGWQVRLQRRGVKYGKYFGDRGYGGSAQALAAAREWRDQVLANLPNEDTPRICTVSSRNSSGVVGVSKVRVMTANGFYQFWQATWSPPDGKRRCVRFSIKRYGNKGAFQLAVEARHEGTRDHE